MKGRDSEGMGGENVCTQVWEGKLMEEVSTSV